MIELAGKKFMVTGGAGFIGSHIAEELVRQGKEVVIVDNFVAGTRENLSTWWNSRQCTLNSNHVADLKPRDLRGIDTVFHNAASKCNVCSEYPQIDLYTNAFGTFHVARLAAEAGARFIHASTGSVYGESLKSWTWEDSVTDPVSFYGVSKLAAEKYLAVLGKQDGLRYTILRYHHVYGARQCADDNLGGVIPIFLRRALTDMALWIHGDGKQTRHFTYVKDVVNANFFVAGTDKAVGQIYNVVSPDRWTVLTLADLIHAKVGKGSKVVVHDQEKPNDIHDFQVSGELLERLGYRCPTSLEDGLDETIKWAREAWGDPGCTATATG
jgi:UDP-glucose 4-epimerase